MESKLEPRKRHSRLGLSRRKRQCTCSIQQPQWQGSSGLPPIIVLFMLSGHQFVVEQELSSRRQSLNNCPLCPSTPFTARVTVSQAGNANKRRPECDRPIRLPVLGHHSSPFPGPVIVRLLQSCPARQCVDSFWITLCIHQPANQATEGSFGPHCHRPCRRSYLVSSRPLFLFYGTI